MRDLRDLLAHTAAELVDPDPAELGGTIGSVLEHIGELVAADRCYAVLAHAMADWTPSGYVWTRAGESFAFQERQAALLQDRAGWTGLGGAVWTYTAGAETSSCGCPALRAQLRDEGVRRALVVPLLRRDATWGVLALEWRHCSGTWTAEDVRELQAIGRILAGGWEHVRRDETLVKAFEALRTRAEARTQELERRQRVSEGLREVLVSLNSDYPLDTILDTIVERACDLLNACSGAIYRVDEQHGVVTLEASYHPPEAWAAISSLPLEPGGADETLVDTLILAEAPLMAPDLKRAMSEWTGGTHLTDPQVTTWYGSIGAGFGALLSVPLTIKDEVYGSLSLYYQEPRSFSETEVMLAATFGDQAALAVENARLREQAERAAVLQERSRLARDLHDSVTQSLYSLTLLAEAARRLAQSGEVIRVAQAIERLGEIGQQCLKEMRLLVYQLRPSALESVGLVGALQHRLDTVERRAGVEATLDVTALPELPSALEAELYHIAQEALNNALKHAAANAVTVEVAAREGCIEVTVQDNGRGFAVGATDAERGLGLVTMRERAERLGGVLEVASGEAAGTRVHVSVPYGERRGLE